MVSQLQAGAEQFTVPFWGDAGENDPDISSDDPTVQSVPLKITAATQVVRKSFLHQSWSDMSLASELSGDDALARVQNRVSAYWDRTWERRLIASLQGVLYSNVANNGSDMVNDISGAAGAAANFSASAVIETALTLGDRLEDVKAIAMHSEALQNDLIEFIPQSQGLPIKTFRGLAVILDDNLTPPPESIRRSWWSLGPLASPSASREPDMEPELFRVPSAGLGGGQSVLHSRMNSALHPLGFTFTGASVAGDSPTRAERYGGELDTSGSATQDGASRVPCQQMIEFPERHREEGVENKPLPLFHSGVSHGSTA
jgi:hypothetical protein